MSFQESFIPPSTRLRRALHLRSLSLVRRILQCHPDNKTLLRNADPDDRYNTSLHLAAQLGLPDIADLLLCLGHEDDGISRSIDGLTPLMLALQAGSDETHPVTAGRIAIGKLLLQRFPEAVTIKDKQGMNSLHHLARDGTTALLPLLLSIPVHINIISHPDNAGNTPLHHASAAGHLKAVRLLVDAGADPSARNASMWTPLDYSFSVAAEVYLRNLMRERAAGKQGGVSGGGSEMGSPTKSGGQRRSPMRLVEAELTDEENDGVPGSTTLGGRLSKARTAT